MILILTDHESQILKEIINYFLTTPKLWKQHESHNNNLRTIEIKPRIDLTDNQETSLKEVLSYFIFSACPYWNKGTKPYLKIAENILFKKLKYHYWCLIRQQYLIYNEDTDKFEPESISST